MSDQDNTQDGTEMENNEAGEQQPDELSLLKDRADLMGIKYHPNIGLDKLRVKVAAAQEGSPDSEEEGPTGHEHEEIQTIQDATPIDPANSDPGVIAAAARRNDAKQLVRIRVTNMNPTKGNMKGEIFSCGNAEIGFVKKYVPYNAEAGWHVPKILLKMLQKKKYVAHYEVKEGNKKIMKQKLVPELAIEILPPLTPQELKELGQRQIMAQGGALD
jgi:hypothetical protein